MDCRNFRLASLVAAAVLAVLSADGVQAQTPASQQRSAGQTSIEAAPSKKPGVLTGKERLGRKWSDEQRLDNCNVPIDKRGPRPRPSECVHAPSI